MTYIGEKGQLGAGLYVPASQVSRLTMRSGSAVEIIAASASTNGQFGMFRCDLVPSVHGPDPHFHRTFAESFYVLSGTVGLYDGARWVDANRGDFMYVPAGGVHAYRPGNDQPASMLVLFTPGTPREEYFREMADISASGRQLSDEEWADLFSRHDQYWA